MELDPNNVKAYYRRGTCLLESGDAVGALDDFLKVQKLEPQNKAAINQITKCKSEIQKESQKEKKLYANMFAKFAESDRKVS